MSIRDVLTALDKVQKNVALMSMRDIDLICRELRVRVETPVISRAGFEDVENALHFADLSGSSLMARILAGEVRRLREQFAQVVTPPELRRAVSGGDFTADQVRGALIESEGHRADPWAIPNSPHFYARKLRAYAMDEDGLFSIEEVGILNAAAAELDKITGDTTRHLSKDVEHAIATLEQYAKMHLAIYRAMGFEDDEDGQTMQARILLRCMTNDKITDQVIGSELKAQTYRTYLLTIAQALALKVEEPPCMTQVHADIINELRALVREEAAAQAAVAMEKVFDAAPFLMDAEPINDEEEQAQVILDNLDGEGGPLQGEAP